MNIEPIDDGLRIAAPAKINVHLEILGKRPDGFHELETVMLGISLFDDLEFKFQSDDITLECNDSRVGPIEDNLVYKAAQLMKQQAGGSQGVAISLTKRIPAGTGLAGGSSDAAATLLGLNQLWNLQWSLAKLSDLAQQLGSDLSFFFHLPLALATGRGEIITPKKLGKPLDLVVIVPDERLATPAVYQQVVVSDDTVSAEAILNALAQGDLEKVGHCLHNRLQPISARLCPAVETLQSKAKDWNCLGHVMTGSGSAYVALCQGGQDAQRLAQHIHAEQLGQVFVVRSCN